VGLGRFKLQTLFHLLQLNWPNVKKKVFFFYISLRNILELTNLWRWVMVFNATFNNISDISWRSVLLVEETVVPGENHRPVASH
jgi:hypothetical protein